MLSFDLVCWESFYCLLREGWLHWVLSLCSVKPLLPEILGKFSSFFFLRDFLFSCLDVKRILSLFSRVTIFPEDLSQCCFRLPLYFGHQNPTSLKAGLEAQVKSAPWEDVWAGLCWLMGLMPVGVWVAVESHTVQMARLRSGVFWLSSVEGETKKQSHLTEIRRGGGRHSLLAMIQATGQMMSASATSSQEQFGHHWGWSAHRRTGQWQWPLADPGWECHSLCVSRQP